MAVFIAVHVVIAFGLLALGVAVALFPKDDLEPPRSTLAYIYFSTLVLTATMGIVIGIYRHPSSVSVFQIATVVAIVLASIGAISLWRRPNPLWGRPWQLWFINGFGGSLIATVVASLFFIALTFARDFYEDNVFVFATIFFTVPILVGHLLIRRSTCRWAPEKPDRSPR